ncbi:ABC transporter ATP-binding protein [Streptococcus constellatus]|uniref:ABC transporter ATP-binding protein n=1 Tax=Streptococcus constellatus TaxID=76860 RepID=UPI00066E031E|nr:ABC transporter ATP-binding protein [Streptococcus constellatus]
MENILEAEIRAFSYGEDLILKDLKLSVKKGEIVVLTGLSGCGKTTLLRLLNGLIPSFYDGCLNGEIKLLGKDITLYKKGELAKYIGNVFQNPKDQFFCDVVEDEIALVGENLGLEKKILREKVDEAMQLLEIEYLRKKSIFELSGGERQKVAIAGTLIYDTDIIFFDEPSSSLDYNSIRKFTEILINLKALGKTIIIAEHRLYYLKDMFSRLVYIKDGTIQDVFQNGQLNNEKCRELELRTFNEKELVSEMEHIDTEICIKVNKANIHQGKRLLIKDLTFDIKEKEIMGIIGSNGIGKTTLGKALCGLSEKYLDASYGQKQRERLRNSYCVLQDVDAQIFLDTVENELIFCKDQNTESDLEKIREYLKDTNLWHKKTNHPQKLSGGQKQRLAIITSFLSGRKLIILDEPTSGLDYKSMRIMSDLITEKAKEIPIIIITHDLELLFKTCHSVLMLGDKDYKKISVKGNEALIMDFMDKKGNLLKEKNYVK